MGARKMVLTLSYRIGYSVFMNKKIVIRIEAMFASDFHEKFGMSALESMLQTWKIYLKDSHKTTKIEYNITNK